MAKERFSIPGSVPIFNLKPGFYYVTLSYQNQDFTAPLIMENVDNPPSTAVHSFLQFVNIVNIAPTTAHTALLTAYPLAPTQPTYLGYDPTSTLFSLYVPQSY